MARRRLAATGHAGKHRFSWMDYHNPKLRDAIKTEVRQGEKINLGIYEVNAVLGIKNKLQTSTDVQNLNISGVQTMNKFFMGPVSDKHARQIFLKSKTLAISVHNKSEQLT